MITAALSSEAVLSQAPESERAGAPGALGTPRALASLDELHALYGRRVFRFLLHAGRNRDLAETLTQETFLRAWGARETFRADANPMTWLSTIALNLLRDHTRTRRFRFWRRAALTAVDAGEAAWAERLAHPASSSESALIAREQLALVWDTVNTLSEAQRTVFLLRFVEELDLQDIAAVTGYNLSTVKSHLYRGLAAVRARNPQAKETR